MHRTLFVASAAVTLAISACVSRAASVSPRVLAAADPAAAEPSYSPPSNPLEDRRPRTLELEIADPTRMHHPETAPEVGTPHEHGGEDHSQHGASSPTPTPKAAPTKQVTPTPTPKAAEPVYACPMHAEVRDTKPSTCPKCGMKLEPVKDAKGTPTPAPSPKATASPTATPSGHEHHHGSAP